MQQRIEEIKSYIEHQDNSLAVRRMLDLCLDTGEETLLVRAIDWSREFHAFQKNFPNDPVPDDFRKKAYDLLGALDTQNGNSRQTPQLLVDARKVSKKYSGSNFSLHPISLKVRTSDVLGIVGENGNGKTTLLRCLAGQLALDEGELEFPQLNNPDPYDIKHHVAFIPQRIPRWHGLLRDNLHFSASLSGITGRQNELMVDFMLERLNLNDYAHLTWNRISSGYRTRFEIARVLLQKPSLLILDEPLANLDINAQQTILTDLRHMAKSVYHPMGILLSSQQLHEVEKIADTVLLIKQGQCLVRTGKDEEIARGFVLELETPVSREEILQALNEYPVQVHFNGGFYTLMSENVPVEDLLKALLVANIQLSYFRDITHSTKRYF
ncbi:MAG TPA: ABC transporter ATP-binding protein [Flavobacteriales bacterium]|nr:ABC transporter ATP-binding protein [Flavobacteriales bacterium]